MVPLKELLLSSRLNPRAGAEEPEIAVVVKIGGIPWFTAMVVTVAKMVW